MGKYSYILSTLSLLISALVVFEHVSYLFLFFVLDILTFLILKKKLFWFDLLCLNILSLSIMLVTFLAIVINIKYSFLLLAVLLLFEIMNRISKSLKKKLMFNDLSFKPSK